MTTVLLNFGLWLKLDVPADDAVASVVETPAVLTIYTIHVICMACEIARSSAESSAVCIYSRTFSEWSYAVDGIEIALDIISITYICMSHAAPRQYNYV